MRLAVESVLGFALVLLATIGAGAVGGWALVKLVEWLGGEL